MKKMKFKLYSKINKRNNYQKSKYIVINVEAKKHISKKGKQDQLMRHLPSFTHASIVGINGIKIDIFVF